MDEARECDKKFDHFMEEVIFPLAEQTNAVIIACAEVEGCVLTKSLTRVFRWMRSRWGQTLPFTILSCTPDIRELYCRRRRRRPNVAAGSCRLLVRAAAVDVVATTIAAACAARLLRSKAAATSISS